MLTRLSQRLDGVGNGGGAGGQGQSGHAALQSGQALFQYILGGVGQAAVNIAGVGQAEAGGGMGGVAEYVRSGLVNGHRAGVGGGVRLLLSHVKLQGFKFILTHRNNLFSSF